MIFFLFWKKRDRYILPYIYIHKIHLKIKSKDIQDLICYFTALFFYGTPARVMRQLSTQNNTHAVIFFPPHFRFMKKFLKFLD